MRTGQMRRIGVLAVLVLGGLCGVFFALRGALDSREVAREQHEAPQGNSLTVSARASAPSSTLSTDSHLVGVGSRPNGTDSSSGKAGIRVSAPINLNKYPGSLGDQVAAALESRNGVMAMDLANALTECAHADQLQASTSNASSDRVSVELQAQMLASAQSRQRVIANCQSVVGGHQKMRSQLLEIALQQKVVGAAAEIYAEQLQRLDTSRRPQVTEGMVADALAGDIKSLVFVAAQGSDAFGVSPEKEQVIRYGFELASRDPSIGGALTGYYATSSSLSAALGNSRFDNSKATEATKSEGRALAERILARIKANN